MAQSPLPLRPKRERIANATKVALALRPAEQQAQKAAIFVFAVGNRPHLIKKLECDPSVIEEACAENGIDVAFVTTAQTWEKCVNSSDEIGKAALESRIEIFGEYREYARITYKIPRWIANCPLNVKDNEV